MWYVDRTIIQPQEGNPAIFDNIDGLRGHYAQCNKSEQNHIF